MADSASTAGRKAKATIGSWWMLAILFLLYTFSFIDRNVMSMLVPQIKAELKLSDVEMGLVLGPAFAIFYSLFGLPLGWASDKFPRRWVIFFGAALFGLATASTSLAGSFLALFLARMFVGIGEASLSPAAFSLIADKFPRNLFATASAIYNTAAKVGTALSFTIGGLVIGLTASLHMTGEAAFLTPWRIVMLATGLPAAVLAVLVFTFREPTRTFVPTRGEAAQNILGFLKAERRVLIPMLIGFSLMALCSYSMSTWAPTYLDRHFHWKPQQYGPMLGLISLLAAGTMVFKGGLVDWLYTRGGKDIHIRFYTWLVMGTIPVALATFFMPNALLFMICYGIVQVVAIPTIVFMSAAIQLIVPGNLRGQITAVFLFCLTVFGGTLGAPSVGFLTDVVFRDELKVGYSMALVLCTAMPLALIALRMSLKPLRAAVIAMEARTGQGDPSPDADPTHPQDAAVAAAPA